MCVYVCMYVTAKQSIYGLSSFMFDRINLLLAQFVNVIYVLSVFMFTQNAHITSQHSTAQHRAQHCRTAKHFECRQTQTVDMKMEIMVKIHAEIMKPPGLQRKSKSEREALRFLVCFFLL